MPFSTRKLLSVCVRTTVVAAIASAGVLPTAVGAEDQPRQITRPEDQPARCEPLLDQDGRPLPGNIGGKGAPRPCSREPGERSAPR